MTKKRGLGQGRGLDALLGSIKQVQAEVASPPANKNELTDILLDQLMRGKYQPRREISSEALTELAESIRQHGVMQPIVVRVIAPENIDSNSPVRYEIIAGERRWRAAQLAGLKSVPAIIRDLSDELAIALALIENIQREDLSPIEQATALQRFHDEFGMSHQAIAETVGKARATVSNLLRLMSLEEDVKTLLSNGDLEMGHARALLGLSGLDQVLAARQVVAKGFSVRQTEKLVRELLNGPPTAAVKTGSHQQPDVAQLANKLAEQWGMPVKIDYNENGSGKITIRYHTLDQLDELLKQFGN